MSSPELYVFNTGNVVAKGRSLYGPKIRAKYPELNGNISMPVFSYLYKSPDGKTTLFDTGMSAQFPFGEGLAGKIRRKLFHPQKMNEIADQLTQRGIRVIDEVIFSHLHTDHITGTFSLQKKLLVGKQYAHSDQIRVARSRLSFIEYSPSITRKLPLVEIDGTDIPYINLPGHTPGHIGLSLGSVLLAGDAIESVLSLEEDIPECVRSETCKLLLSSHDFHIAPAQENFLESPQFQAALERQRKALERQN